MAALQRKRQGKLLRKIRRKQAQFKASEPTMGVTFLDDDALTEKAEVELESPRERYAHTREYHIFVGNGGTANGISREVLTSLLGNVDSLYMPEGKDFSFVSVAGRQEAIHLLKHCNGICIQDACKSRNMCHLISPSLLEGPPLYIYNSLVDCIPASLLRCKVSGSGSLPPGLILVQDFVSAIEEKELLDCFAPSECKERYEQALVCTPEPFTPDPAILQDSTLTLPSVRSEVCTEKDCSTISGTEALTHTEETHLSPSTYHSSHTSPSPVISSLKHRKVSHYGYEFLYGSNTVDPDQPLPGGIPPVCSPLLERVRDQGLLQWPPDQLTVNDYLPGAGIPPHVDTHSPFEDGIVSLSLGSQVVMDFRHPYGRKVSVFLPRRSLMVMTGESRYLWSHGITPRKTDEVYHTLGGYDGDTSSHCQGDDGSHDNSSTVLLRHRRVSLTFRKVKRSPCTCKYPTRCDSQII